MNKQILVNGKPLFFKAQRGEIAISVWHDKVDEIRQRYPKENE